MLHTVIDRIESLVNAGQSDRGFDKCAAGGDEAHHDRGDEPGDDRVGDFGGKDHSVTLNEVDAGLVPLPHQIS